LLTAATVIAIPVAGRQAAAVGTQLFAPLELGLSQAAGGIAHFGDTVRHAGELARQNDAYRQEIDRLQAQAVQARELQLENADLRQLLGLRAQATLGTMLSVNVIARDPVSIVQAVTVDRGAQDGVTVNAPVITWRGVVGRVVEVHPSSSKVLLTTDVNSAVSARIQAEDSRATGTIRGTGDGRLIMQYVPREDPLRTGDLAITSGIGGTFPAGLVVGKVVQVRQKDVEVFQEALVEPAVDMRNLERLYVLQRPPAPGGASPASPSS
jgi:rod shape-determining protein MreC